MVIGPGPWTCQPACCNSAGPRGGGGLVRLRRDLFALVLVLVLVGVEIVDVVDPAIPGRRRGRPRRPRAAA